MGKQPVFVFGSQSSSSSSAGGALPGGYRLGDVVYYQGVSKRGRVEHGARGEIAGPASTSKASKQAALLGVPDHSVAVLFPWSQKPIDCRLSLLSSSKPPPLPGGHCAGDRLFYTGPSRTFKSGGRLDHGAWGEVAGLSESPFMIKLHFVQSPKATVGGIVECHIDSLSGDPPPVLPGDYVVGDEVYYVGPPETFDNGDRLMPGARGRVVGPAAEEDPEDSVAVMLPPNNESVDCYLNELSSDPPEVETAEGAYEQLAGAVAAGDFRRALELCDLAQELDPDTQAPPFVYAMRAQANLECGHWERAVRDATTALATPLGESLGGLRKAGSSWIRSVRAMAYASLGQWRLSVDDIAQIPGGRDRSRRLSLLAEFRPGRAATSDPSADIKAVAACAEKASRAARIVNRDRDEVEVFESMLEELPEAVQLYDEAIGECPPSQPGCGAQIRLLRGQAFLLQSVTAKVMGSMMAQDSEMSVSEAAGQLLRKARETFQEARDDFAAVLAMPQSLLPGSARAKPLLGHLESSLELGDQAAARAALEQLRALGLLQGLLDGREELRTAVRAFLASESDAAAARADALAEELIRQEEAVQREAAERKGGRAAKASQQRGKGGRRKGAAPAAPSKAAAPAAQPARRGGGFAALAADSSAESGEDSSASGESDESDASRESDDDSDDSEDEEVASARRRAEAKAREEEARAEAEQEALRRLQAAEEAAAEEEARRAAAADAKVREQVRQMRSQGRAAPAGEALRRRREAAVAEVEAAARAEREGGGGWTVAGRPAVKAQAQRGAASSPPPQQRQQRALPEGQLLAGFPDWSVSAQAMGRRMAEVAALGGKRVDLRYPHEHIGRLIGAGGSAYRDLCKRTGAHIFILDKEGPPPGWGDESRLVCLMGTEAQVRRARSEVMLAPYDSWARAGEARTAGGGGGAEAAAGAAGVEKSAAPHAPPRPDPSVSGRPTLAPTSLDGPTATATRRHGEACGWGEMAMALPAAADPAARGPPLADATLGVSASAGERGPPCSSHAGGACSSVGGAAAAPAAVGDASRRAGGVLGQMSQLEAILGLDGEGKPPLLRLDLLERVIGIVPTQLGLVPRLLDLQAWAREAGVM